MSDERTVLEAVARAAQACFQQHPVVILGSGASVPHKIRGMGELATFSWKMSPPPKVKRRTLGC